ncbi:hypothetical protein PVAND_010625 [Polypedilum vanderplanki]|uniref:Transcription elongation factor SPT6 n=1 Tax=Polypedilum vanderplanki TaxID=319348 RepID=A0A9J6CGU4_POLVA|nr:hypothetical protein PVAND_010625 [Polypedilum vanderplanki]
MSGFVHSEAEETDSEIEDELDNHEKKRLKKMKAMSDSEEEEEDDDEDKIREELKDLIDDNPIEEDESDAESDSSRRNAKRKKSDDEDDELDDRLEDEDYDLIEENLGVKVERKRFKRLKRITDEESDTEERDESLNREVLADQLFVGSDEEQDAQEDDRRSERNRRAEPERYDDEMSDESDADDFIVDDYGNSIAEKRKKRKPVFTDAALQEGQDIFGVDFDYNEFENYEEDEYEDESADEDEYEDEDREKRTKKATRKKVQKKSIFDIYEPSELKRGHFTDLDNIIRKTDIPERMQLREVPIQSVPEGSTELDEEAEWIYRQAFYKKPISQVSNEPRKQHSAVSKIKKTLDFIRNQHLEVPFINFYRKEYVNPELKTKDLWKVYRYDGRWCILQSRKKALLQLFEKIRDFQLEQIADQQDNTIPEDMVLIRDDDIERLKNVQTPEELRDIHDHFLLHCAPDVEGLKNIERQKKNERNKETRDERIRERKEALNAELKEIQNSIEDEPTEEEEEKIQRLREELESLELGEDVEEENAEKPDEVKVSRNSGPYARCRKAGICRLAKLFGLSPEQFAENLRDGYQRHEVEQIAKDPLEVAKDYISSHFTTVEDVMSAAKFVVARQIAREPLLRKTVREIFYERAKVCVRPTKKGLKEIDEFHACYTLKYLKDKPVNTFKNDEYLRLKIAEQDKLLTVTINDYFEGNSSNSYLDEIKQLYNRDEFAQHVQNWNKYRFECVEIALTKMVLPDLRKELDAILLAEAKDYVSECCGKKIRDWIQVAPYDVGDIFDENDFEWETSKGIRVMGLAFVPDFSQAAFCVIVNHDGDVTDYLRLPHILKRKNSNNKDDKSLKESDLDNLAEFMRNKKPHVVAIGGESREALMIQADLREVIQNLVDDDKFPEINVEILDNDFAKIYANSKKAETDFREYPLLLRQAISIARRLRDPLVEFSQLCSPDEEIMCLRYHTLQDQLTKEEFSEAIYTEFINQTNEVGVDINLAVQNPLTMNLVQFICGLGPRKGQALIKILKQTNQRLENRTQLVTSCHMGPKVFINCSGFIKIDTNSLGDSTESYVEVLDGSRVHPETYEWARKMAVDALEYDDDGANPAGALEEILENPEKLKDLDLDAFAFELERQGFGNKAITLYDIRDELECRYRDRRVPFEPPKKEVLFDILTKESAETFYVGKMVSATVTGISHKKPSNDQLDGANPERDPETGLWCCTFCSRRDFPELSDVWEHFDNLSCYGTAIGVKLRLDNGLNGFIHIKNLSDKHVKNPEERVQPGMPIHVRITKIDTDKFTVDCTSKTSDLADKANNWRPHRDDFYDNEAEESDLKKDSDAKKIKTRQQYTKRVIVHPSFQNISYADAVKLLKDMDQGEVIVRPSSKGTDHLTATWKVTDDVFQHIDVKEVGKENTFSLGTSLFIGLEEFEDLDEIIARHINPMAGYARDLIGFKYYRKELGGIREKAEELLKEEKKKNPNKIHYFISASKHYPGKFMISYQPRANCKHEYISITPDGYKFRQQIFDNINSLMKWFKDHYKDPLPVQTPSTPRGGSSRSYSTPGLSVHNEAIQRVAQNLPTHMFNSLAQATNTTPHYPQANTPYTPSGQTPFLAFTPHSSQTPRYGQMTPTQHGQFLRPSAPVSRQPTNYRASPYTGASPRVQQQPRRAQSQEEEDWDRASNAWGGSRNKGSTPRGDSMGRSTPRDSSGRRDEYQPKRTPSYEMERPSSRTSVRSSSGRSVRTDTSPHSIMIDSTPLYDE